MTQTHARMRGAITIHSETLLCTKLVSQEFEKVTELVQKRVFKKFGVHLGIDGISILQCLDRSLDTVHTEEDPEGDLDVSHA